MTNPTLTQAEIDAMEALVKEISPAGWLAQLHFESAYGRKINPMLDNSRRLHPDLEFVETARTFIPKAIAVLRRNREWVENWTGKWESLYAQWLELHEQNRWRHIDQEQPIDLEPVIVWDKLSSCNKSSVMIYNGIDGILKNSWTDQYGNFYDSSCFNYWKPLPQKGPDMT